MIRAAALAIAVAISFGLHLPNAYWMPIATIIAMKPDLQQSALVAERRIAGTVVGAAVAALVLLAVDNRTALEVIVVVLVALAASIHGVNYAWYTAAYGRGHPDRRRRAPPVQPYRRGTQDPVHVRRRGDRRHRHVPGGPAAKARRQSGTTGTCSPGPGGLSGQGAPSARRQPRNSGHDKYHDKYEDNERQAA